MIRLLRKMASLRLTLAGLLLLLVGLVLDQNYWLAGALAITPPLGLLVLNLGAAMITDPRFRRQPALFAFHLCLLLLALLAGYGQLVGYQGRVLLAEGQAFADGIVTTIRQGPLPRQPLRDGVVRQGTIEVDYTAGLRRGATRSQLWVDGLGWREIGDDVPLILDGYRFYTTSNKGFAALLTWHPDRGAARRGTVNFPSYPAKELGQLARWQTPAGEDLKLSLALPPSSYGDRWTLRQELAEGVALELVAGDRALLMRPGDTAALRGGRLHYQRLGMWMGYELRYDPTLPWLFSLAALAVLLMAVHFARRMLQPVPVPAAVNDRICRA